MDKLTKDFMKLEAVLVLILVALICLLFLCGCTTTKYVEVEKVRTDTVWQNHTARDSIFVRDSVHIKEKGDTVWVEKWKTVWQNHTAHDSVYIHKTDSVPVPYPVIKEVEKPLTKTQKGLMGVGILTLMGLIVFIAWKLKRFLP